MLWAPEYPRPLNHQGLSYLCLLLNDYQRPGAVPAPGCRGLFVFGDRQNSSIHGPYLAGIALEPQTNQLLQDGSMTHQCLGPSLIFQWSDHPSLAAPRTHYHPNCTRTGCCSSPQSGGFCSSNPSGPVSTGYCRAHILFGLIAWFWSQ